MNQKNYIALLLAFGSSRRRRVQPCQLYDSNVSTSKIDESTGWTHRLISGYMFSHQIHMTHRRRRIHIAASEEYICLQVEGRLHAGQCSINRPNRVSFVDVPTGLRVSRDASWPVFVPRWGEQGPALANFLDNPSVNVTVGMLIKSPEDGVHVFEDGICAYSHPGSVETLQSAIDSVCESVGPRMQMSRKSLRSLPPNLQPLVPLIQKWAEGDDSWREELLRRASKADVARLIETVSPYFGQINEYLDANDDEAACALGRLAELVAEAKLQRGNQETNLLKQPNP